MTPLSRLRASPANGAIRVAIRYGIKGGRMLERVAPRWNVRGTPLIYPAGVPIRMIGRCDDPILTQVYYGATWEQSALRFWRILCPAAPRIMDIGANTGVYALVAAAVNPTASIVAFEPAPANLTRLQENVALNGARIDIVGEAVGDVVGKVAFRVPSNGQIIDVASAVTAFSDAHYGISYIDISVRQTTVDESVAMLGGGVDLIKIDVEYYELAVLRGAEATLRASSPVLLLEVFDYDIYVGRRPELANKVSKTNHADVAALLRDHGYVFYALGARGLFRVSDFSSTPDENANYVATKVRSAARFIPFDDDSSVKQLIASGHDAALT